MASPSERPQSFGSLIGLAPAPLLCAIVLAILSAGLSLAPFVFLYLIALEIYASPVDVDAIRQLALYALCALLARWLLMAASHVFAHVGAFSVLYQLRLALARQLTRVPMSFFSRHKSGALRKTVVDDTASLEGFLAHVLPDAVAATVIPLGALAILFVMDWRLTLAALVPLPLAVGLQAVMMHRAGKSMSEWQNLQSRIAAQIVEYLRGMPAVKVFGLSARSFGELADAVNGAVDWVDRYSRQQSAGWAIFMALLSAGVIFVGPLGAWLYARGEADAPTIVLFLLVAPAVLQPLLRLTFALGEQMRRAEALGHVDNLLKAPALLAVADTGDLPGRSAPHDVEFRNVVFSYAEADRSEPGEATALSDVSFRVAAGGITALVGPSGAGKSTVARLLPRFYDVSQGAIYVAGQDLRQWPIDTLLSRISIVFQDVFLFHGTIGDNLRVAKQDASLEELIAASTAARAHDFIQRLPQGYDTPVGERGARLSGGERQRLSIARALLKDAPILLLDEATSYADAENELLIQEALNVACRGRTVLTIAHRLHTIRHADHIVVLEAGGVVGQGRHEALLAGCPLYERLWRDHELTSDWRLSLRKEP